MERQNIDIQYTWDLSPIYAHHQDFYKDLDKAKELLTSLLQQKDLFLKDVNQFLKFHQEETMLSRYIQKLHCFAHLHCDVEPNNQEYQTMYAAIFWKPWIFGLKDSHLHLATHSGILSS